MKDTRTGYLVPVHDALWAPARMEVWFPRRRRRRRRRHSENSERHSGQGSIISSFVCVPPEVW